MVEVLDKFDPDIDNLKKAISSATKSLRILLAALQLAGFVLVAVYLVGDE